MAARLMSLILKFLSTDSSMVFIRSEIIDVELSQNSVIAMNGLLYDPLTCVVETQLLDDVISLSLNAARSTDVTSELGIMLISGLHFGSRRSGPWKNNDESLD
jgi:hypothetical protein